MKTTSMVLGIIGGLIALIYGFFGYAFGSLADGAEAAGIVKLVSLALPISALVGAGFVKSKPLIGAILMAIPAVGFVMVFGFGNFVMVPVLLLGIAALLGFLALQEESKSPASES